MRQQRRKNAPTAQTTFAPYPQLYDNWILTASGASTVLLTSAWPLATPGIPQLILNDVDAPVSITRPNDNEVELTYPNPIGIDAVLRLAAWDANIRGFNGEWLAPKASTLNSSVPTTEVIWTLDVITLTPTQLQVRFSENVTILSLPTWLTDGAVTPITAVPGVNPNLVALTYAAPVTGFGGSLEIGQGDTSVQGVSGFFPAPCFQFVQ